METVEMKTINYRGGIVRFRIPANWEEEYEKAGGGTFYRAGEDTGTLRLNVLTFQAPADQQVDTSTAADTLETFARKYGVPIIKLHDGIAAIRYDETSEEQGDRLIIRYWQVAQFLPPKIFRHAIFSYTLLEAQPTQPTFAAELDLLEREIYAAEFAMEVGEIPKKKPWWRPW